MSDGDWLERARQAYEKTPPPEPGAKERLQQKLEAEPLPTPWRRLSRKLGAGLAWAAVILAVVATGVWLKDRGASPVSQAVVDEGADTLQVVRFVLRAPEASRVSLVGDFNGWDKAAAPMQREDSGMWVVSLPVTHGRHVYAYFVDQERWVSDPHAPLAPEDGFGVPNSVIVVGTSGGT